MLARFFIQKKENRLMKTHYIAIDVDGTLLDDHDHYDQPRLVHDINELTKRGITFIVASGNSLDALQGLFPPLVNNFVAENGGRVIIGGHEIMGHPHQMQTVTHLLTFFKELPTADLISASGTTQTFIMERFNDVAVPYYPHHSYFTSLADITEPIYNLNINWHRQRLPQERINEIVKTINNTFSEVNATYSGAYGIDILPAGVNKATGLQQFVQHTGGTLDQVMAFGDTSNDIEMLQAVGIGVAMKNATPDLRAVADRITPLDNSHDGLLSAIEEIIAI